MIIEKIELENFMCYAGKSCMEFTEGINVIIGDNGYGKSKLYDAFYWVMYDQVFVPEKKEFQNTKAVKSKIISDKAKSSAEDGKVSTSVSITFHNLEKDNVYILERKYTANILDGKIVETNDSEFTVMKKDLSYLNAKMVNDEEEKRRIVSNILPPKMKDYLWFQGEQVESIIDFNKQDTLTKAINVLSNITRYDELKEIAAAAAKSGNTEYDREVRRLSKDMDKSEELGKQKTKLEERVADLQKDEKEVNENLSRAEARCEELLNKQADAQKVNELQERKKGVFNLLNELNEALKEEQFSFHRKMFRNKWVLKGTESLHAKFSNRFKIYEYKKLEAAAKIKATLEAEDEVAKKLQTRLPLDVPEPIYVQRMLDDEKCLVCDREAKKDSDAWYKIKELIDRPDKKLKSADDEPISKQNFTDDFKRLYQNGLALTHRIEEIDSDIKETLKKISSINTKIKDANKQMNKVEEDIQKLLSDTSLTSEQAANILNEYSIQNKKSKDFKDELNKITQQIEHFKSNLKSVNDQLKELVTGEIPKWLIEKKDVLNDFESIASSTRERVFSNLIAQLELETNKHYMEMTKGNLSVRGKVKLRRLPNQNYMPEITDTNGLPLPNLNMSNYKLVKFAAIMAIVSATQSQGTVSLYTLISDAPTAFMAENYTIGFCRELSKVYRQSIIMSYEFYNNEKLRTQLLTNPEINIGNVFQVTPTLVENERGDRANLSTKITKLN
jgi:DNA sulfur modification protein DndD